MQSSEQRVLLLGSSSASRQKLLKQAGIKFIVIGHTADETSCGLADSLPELVGKIARLKMEHVSLPTNATEGDICFVLTADTLNQDSTGAILGKPVDRADAARMLKAASQGITCTGTAFCLEKKIYQSGRWLTQERIEQYAQGTYLFCIAEELMEDYFNHSDYYLQTAGAIAIEEYGIQYFKEVYGSFTAIVGLPMYELYQALIAIGFFKK